MTKETFLKEVKYDAQGLVPVIAQDVHSKKVRMLAYMNEESLKKTIETGKVHYYSRSRNELWLKGETSSNYQYLKSMSIDCDGDTLLLQIEQQNGISCHTGNSSCFFRELKEEIKEVENTEESLSGQADKNMLTELYDVIYDRKIHPKEGSYTNYLFEKGVNKILKKVGEECTEVVIAAKEEKNSELAFEISDLMYHLTVLIAEKGLTWQEVESELKKRK
ncbi:bifunctional phosphoribosyl-AMP cyclohydrolase/phosphoribosyl-ATP diphosphatase HisIE [Cellulosilyticum sp. I15G10I2]|uniref:bifunctional phosphoribosyl-AMP cyclohydrolase/phosphoribosyl-ATP diphosphatase HisIE n=1 Tax=Cellulosilyticum sp. I15G10I2 TaxID=1892843 RepID=UPI00085C9AAB|nr:bifunctional phosphoribosyl-AMP cyclohydrolase/phosphoribosyl-ATP diphosphatase HisIE [Cellulosilyticum sp. I15G10I2]